MLDRDLILVLLNVASLRGQQRLRMVAAWPKVGKVAGREALLKRWALVASVPLTIARLLGPALLENGICTEGGGVDDTAAAVVDQELVNALERPKRATGRGPSRDGAPTVPGARREPAP